MFVKRCSKYKRLYCWQIPVPGLVVEASTDAHALVLEALERMPPHAPLEPLVATMALSQQEVHASAVRRARMQAAGRYLVD